MNKNIMIIWGMIVVLICTTLIVISYSKKDKILLKLERDIKISVKEYINKNNIEVTLSKPVVVGINDLLESGLLKENKDIDKYCIKTVLVTREIFYNKYIINKDCNDKN